MGLLSSKLSLRAIQAASASACLMALASTSMALEPAEIAVLFNTKSPSSLQVARYYLNSRKVPATHLIPITCEVGENISDEDYNKLVVPQVLKALREKKLMPDERAGITGVKCLVTTFDLPLRVLAHQPTAPEKAEIAGYEKQIEAIVTDLQSQIAAFDRIAPAAAPTATAPATAPAAKPTWQQTAVKLNAAATAAGKRIDNLPDAARTAALGQFVKVQEHVGGMSALLNSLRVPENAPGADPRE